MTSDAITFKLLRPFSANAMYVSWHGTSGRVHSKAYDEWLRTAGWAINACRSGHPWTTISHPVHVRIETPASLRFDVDNINKPILDLLQRMRVITNDKIVDSVSVARANRSDVLIAITAVEKTNV